jgi:hypothetical protein
MASFLLPPGGGTALQRRLYDEYRVEVPIIEWGGWQFVRVSTQGYSTREDVKALAVPLKELVPLEVMRSHAGDTSLGGAKSVSRQRVS